MSRSIRPNAVDDGRRVVLALGALYVLLAVLYPFVSLLEPLAPFVEDRPLATDLLLVVLVGGPGAALLLAGRWLAGSDVRPETFHVVARWCLGGIAAMLGLLGLVWLVAGVDEPVPNVLILTAVGAVAGLAAGVHDARAKTRSLELEETIDRLRRTNERLSQFTYAASHDLQEPLRMVSSYLRLLESRHAGELDDEALEYLDFAVAGADRMRAMVDSLYEYSRVTPFEAPLEQTDAGVVLEEVLDDLDATIEETGATVTADDLPTVTADATQLAHLFRNLLSNALQYNGDESPRVHVGVASGASGDPDGEAAEQAGDLGGAEPSGGLGGADPGGDVPPEDEWRFSVTDEGRGIAPEYHDRLFGAFERFDAGDTSDPDAGGTGLALCERIVERHGGDIWVESAADEGATFYFTLPAAEPERPEQAPDQSVPE